VVKERLADLRGNPRFDSGAAPVSRRPEAAARPVRGAAGLRDLGRAPEFTRNERWWGTPGGAPLRLRGLRGRVVLVDFWTYTCINCLRTLPHLKAWDSRYRRQGLTVVGVHTPEFPFERSAENVRRAIAANGLGYPVAQDNAYATWIAWDNQYWPAKYLIDARGHVRYTHFGEGGYRDTEEAIRALLKEAGDTRLGRFARARAETADPRIQTPETYLGSERAEAFLPLPPAEGTHRYPGARELPPGRFALRGVWRTAPESSTAVRGGSLDARFVAKKVFFVMGSDGRRPRNVRVFVDGKPVADRVAGEDVEGGVATVTGERLYRLVSLPRAGEHRLSLRFDRGVTGYAFTFG
jgi:thiol-disulfide isomerase/thioredoxin